MSFLLPADYEMFLALRITRDIVDRARIFRVTRDEAAATLGINLDSDGICYPYFLPPLNGNDPNRPVAYTVRQDRPPVDARGKQQRKYVHTPGNQYPYLAAVPQEWCEDRSVPVLVMEAQKSAAAALRWCEDHNRRMIPVGIAGCYGWRGKTAIEGNEHGEREEVKGILPQLAQVCRGHRVYILLDANSESNPDVERGRAWLARTLLAEKISDDVRLLRLPQPSAAPGWNGPDDFIAVNGDEAFFDVLETAQRFESGDWRRAFHRLDELAEGEPEEIIAGYYEEGLSFFGAKSGVAKTWLSIAEGQALRTGAPFLGVFRIPRKRNVLYLIPEMTERRFRNRCEKLGMDIHDEGFLVRTMNDGAPLPLDDPAMRAVIEELHPVVYLDTAVRFNQGKEENSSGAVNAGLIRATYQLIKMGSPAVRALHHREKKSTDDDLTLENVLRGSGDFGASAVCVWGAVHETALRAGKLETVDMVGRQKPDSAARKKLERDYLEESRTSAAATCSASSPATGIYCCASSASNSGHRSTNTAKSKCSRRCCLAITRAPD